MSQGEAAITRTVEHTARTSNGVIVLLIGLTMIFAGAALLIAFRGDMPGPCAGPGRG